MPSLDIVTVYKYPKDYPNEFVARASHFLLQFKQFFHGDIIIRSPHYFIVEKKLLSMRLTKVQRMPEDDPCILETWI